MMRNLLRCTLLIFSAAALITGCSSSNGEAPAETHPANWYQLHRATATTSAFASECGGCHVVKDLPGPAMPPSCFSGSVDGRVCHVGGPGQAPHPLDGSYLLGSVHGKAAKADLTSCQNCHSSNPAGGPGSNPRFNFGINNPTAPSPGTGCEQCHGVNYAHPALWAGPNSTFHYSAGNIQAACTLCHGVALNGVGGVGVSCQGCHAETTAFTLNCTSCHGMPPDGTTAEPVVAAEGGILVNHTAVPLGSHDQCATCHGVKITNPGPSGLTGTLNPSANYQAFNKTSDTLGDHWNGALNMSGPSALDPNNTSGLNGGTRYNSANFGCDLACHANDATHRLSDSNLPLAFGDYGSGQAPHAVGNDWLLLSQHATQAVNATPGYCVGCHTLAGGGSDPACQSCHQVAPKMDLTTNGCTSCHGAVVGPDGVNPVATRPNRAGKHGQHVAPAAASQCSACHQGGGSNSLTHYDRTGVTPNYPAEVNFLAAYNAKSGVASYSAPAQTCAKVSCHGGFTTPNWSTGALPLAATASTSNTYCRSCHVFGTSEYNGFSSGDHSLHVNNYLCVDCHDLTVLQNGVGDVGPTHWSALETTAFELNPADTVGALVTSYDGTSCTAACHVKPPVVRTW